MDEDADGVDSDGDSVPNACDNCRFAYNPSQRDTDADAVGDSCDNCLLTPNPEQTDFDADFRGDACDNCPQILNALQEDLDGDGAGNACDNCVDVWNPGQADLDSDRHGDACDNCPTDHNFLQDDLDGDEIGDVCDNCIFTPNADQQDLDGDGMGDLCDSDRDGDGVPDASDLCPSTPDPDQLDFDGDGLGDACDPCPQDIGSDPDADEVCGAADNCPNIRNPDQSDFDGDLEGDACDLDDGLIYISLDQAMSVQWQPEIGFSTFNLYRGDLAALTDTDGDGAAQEYGGCLVEGLQTTLFNDSATPPAGEGFFYIATGRNASGESTLGRASSGAIRPNAHPCGSLFGAPPVIESLSVVVGPESVACDFSRIMETRFCVFGYPGLRANPPIIIGGTYTQVRFETRVTDPDSTPMQSNILLVAATLIPPDSTSESTLVLFDDGSENKFPQAQRVPGIGEDCTVDEFGNCSCQGAIYLVDSNDQVKADDLYTRGLAFVNVSTSPYLQDCIMKEKRQVPYAVPQGSNLNFRVDAVDRQGNLTTWPAPVQVTTGQDTFECTGDPCGCCFLLSNDPFAECRGLPGMQSENGSFEFCRDAI